MNHNEGDKMDDNNQKLNGWGQNNGIPEAWGKQNSLPEGWGKQSSDNSQNIDTSSIYDTAKSSAEKLSETATKVGGAAKNAANRAVEFAKSDEVKEKLNAAKNKAKSLADGAGSAFAGLKEKTGEAINERRAAKEKSVEISDNPKNLISDTEISENVTSDLENEYISDEQVFNEAPIETVNKIAPSVNTNSIFHYTDNAYSSPTEREIPVNRQIEEEFIYQTQEKKSSKKPIIIGIIAGLSVCAVFTAGLLGGQHLMKNNKNNNTPDNNDIPVQVTESQKTEESATSPPVKTTVVKTEIFTETPTEVVTEFELPDKNEDSDSHSSQTLFSDNINDYPLYLERIQYIVSLINQGCNWGEFIQKELSIHYYNENASDSLNNCGYALYDLNDDGFPELILAKKNDTKVIEIYTVYDNQLVNLCCSQERNVYFLCENNVISSAGSSGASTGGTAYFAYSGGNELTNLVTLSYEFNENGEKTFYKNQEQIAQNEAEKILNSYNEITLNTTAISNIPNSNNSNNTRKEYTFEEIKSKAGYDFNFYAYSDPYTIVNTERDPLNLRAAPSTNADIITTIPKGTYVTAHAGNGEWSLISYYNEEDDILYYGFASSQYLY